MLQQKLSKISKVLSPKRIQGTGMSDASKQVFQLPGASGFGEDETRRMRRRGKDTARRAVTVSVWERGDLCPAQAGGDAAVRSRPWRSLGAYDSRRLVCFWPGRLTERTRTLRGQACMVCGDMCTIVTRAFALGWT